MNEGDFEVVLLNAPDSKANYKRLVVEPDKCQGCKCCEFACSIKNYDEFNPARSRIHVVRSEPDGGIVAIPVVCQQCEDPICMAVCPTHVLRRDKTTGAIVVEDPAKCLGCRTCVEMCPFGAPFVDPRTGVSEKCDLCGGDPTCVKFCSFGALQFVSLEEESMTRRRDMVEPYLAQMAKKS